MINNSLPSLEFNHFITFQKVVNLYELLKTTLRFCSGLSEYLYKIHTENGPSKQWISTYSNGWHKPLHKWLNCLYCTLVTSQEEETSIFQITAASYCPIWGTSCSIHFTKVVPVLQFAYTANAPTCTCIPKIARSTNSPSWYECILKNTLLHS